MKQSWRFIRILTSALRVRNCGIQTLTALGALVPLFVIGCATQKPKAVVSHPNVFTMEQLLFMGESVVPKELNDGASLTRYFGTTVEAWPQKQLRVDEMLEEAQRSSSYSQASLLKIVADLRAKYQPAGSSSTSASDGGTEQTPTATNSSPTSESPTAAPKQTATPAATASATSSATVQGSACATPTADPATQPVAKPADAVDSLAMLALVSDSPFDRIDRATSLFTSLKSKFLRRSSDVRSVNMNVLIRLTAQDCKDLQRKPPKNPAERKAWDEKKCRLSSDCEAIRKHIKPLLAADYRQYMLVQQVSIDPGNEEDRMVGVRVKIQSAPGGDGSDRSDRIQILRVHPDRAYDVDPTSFAESLDQALTLTGAFQGTAGTVDLEATGTREARLRAEARRSFVQRISKHGSFIDAPQRTYGWNFYPSNIEVVERPAFARLWGMLFGTPAQYETRARLEAGGRDTMVFLLVPSDVTSITFTTWSVEGGIDSGETQADEPLGSFVVELPDKVELPES